jgi:hypothetical protein
MDPKWSGGVEQWLATAGVRVVRPPPRAPNRNAYAERFVRSRRMFDSSVGQNAVGIGVA